VPIVVAVGDGEPHDRRSSSPTVEPNAGRARLELADSAAIFGRTGDVRQVRVSLGVR
jgi:hypothetical protein